MAHFVAIDFETADRGADSACALGLVKVVATRITQRKRLLIRPPRRRFAFTEIHGITWARVAQEPTFGEIWPEVRAFINGADFLAAHNAPFDRGVLEACCRAARITPPRTRYLCTVEVARKTWGIYPTRLPDVCRRLHIPLDHHEPLSDAEACARIVIASERALRGSERSAGARERRGVEGIVKRVSKTKQAGTMVGVAK